MENLTRAVDALNASVAELSARLDVQERVLLEQERQRKGLHSTRVVLVGLAFGIILDLVLTVAVGILYRQVDANQHQVQAIQSRTSSEILCPLYTVFATSIKVNPPSSNLTPEQAQARRDAADTILAGLTKLGCS